MIIIPKKCKYKLKNLFLIHDPKKKQFSILNYLENSSSNYFFYKDTCIIPYGRTISIIGKPNDIRIISNMFYYWIIHENKSLNKKNTYSFYTFFRKYISKSSI